MDGRPKGTRTGYTTGANATACVVAALRRLLEGSALERVRITLPEGQTPEFEIAWTRLEPDGSCTCATVKDAGDDPDVTHKAEIRANVRWNGRSGEPRFLAGEGVGTVTRPGLGLEVGGPAINPVPRAMMREHVRRLLEEHGRGQEGVDLTVGVKDGESLARRTLNGRLGIVGGLSILGRTGIVHPYSAAAFVAALEQGVDVAAAQGCRTVVLTTGGVTEGFAMARLPELPESAFVQMGDQVGAALDRCALRGVEKVLLAGQMGKVTKLAQGLLQTHARRGDLDLGFLAQMAGEAGASEGEVATIAAGTTARFALETGLGRPWFGPFTEALCARAAAVARARLDAACEGGAQVRVESWLFDFEKGEVLARAGA